MINGSIEHIEEVIEERTEEITDEVCMYVDLPIDVVREYVRQKVTDRFVGVVEDEIFDAEKITRQLTGLEKLEKRGA